MKRIVLKKGKTAAVERFHPWVFSGAVSRREGDPVDGDAVEVYSHDDRYLATGHFQDGSILVRICSFEKTNLKQNFWNRKIKAAWHYRQHIGLLANVQTTCYRLIHGEGDGLPGLVIDVYGKTAVVQCHSIGMHLVRDKLAIALQNVLGDALTAIYDKSSASLPKSYAAEVTDGYLFGEAEPGEVLEYGHAFAVDWEQGQKTGFFLDQRENRQLLAHYAPGKRVLNAFCYSGGFSIYALKAGAQSVDSVDISQKAIDWTSKNAALNTPFSGTHRVFAEDVMQYFKREDLPDYDLMIVDPPAFAKSVAKRHNAVQAYKRLNTYALRRIQRNGILFTFSCSQVVGEQLFYNTIIAAAIEAKRRVRLMHRLTQPADHPVGLFHPEGAYLKGLVLWVE